MRPVWKALLTAIGMVAVGFLVNIASSAVFGWVAAGLLLCAVLVQAALIRETGDVTAVQLADHLGKAVYASWQPEEARRKLHQTPLPIRWTVRNPSRLRVAVASRAFGALPGAAAVTETQVRAGGGAAELYDLYAGLGSGRIVLSGPPGSGKTGAAVLLLMEALRRRSAQHDDALRARLPVPILIDLAGWRAQAGVSLPDWLGGRLSDVSPRFRGRRGMRRAAELIAAGQVSVLLDGLDDVPEPIRQSMIEAIDSAPIRIVLLSRPEAVDQLRRQLPAAVHLQLSPIAGEVAADWLAGWLDREPAPDWAELLRRLRLARRGDILAGALCTPLALSLVRDVYVDQDDLAELLAVDAVEDHLLDQFIEAAYRPRGGQPPPPCGPAGARNALGVIAERMSRSDTPRDLGWWQIPDWTPRPYRICCTAVLFVPLSWYQFGNPLVALAPAVLGEMLRIPLTPQRYVRAGWRGVLHLSSLGVAVGIGLAAGLLYGFTAGPAYGWAVAPLYGIAAGVVAGRSRLVAVDAATHDPMGSWRDRRWTQIQTAVVLGIVGGVAAGFVVARTRTGFGWSEIAVSLLGGLIGSFLLTLPVGVAVSGVWRLGTACLYLRITDDLPLRTLQFLEDARRRDVLRTIGPAYQFRHARLQDRLADGR
jgi:hypothetical protein